MGRKIYWAAPLHDKDDQERNAKYVQLLRRAGHTVYVPQEHGVWEDLAKQFTTEEQAREYLFKLDMQAMREADTCVACCGDLEHQRGPSEGMLWEMGWMTAAHKNVFLFNEGNYWRFNLMPQFGSTRVVASFSELIAMLDEEAFV